MEIKVNSLFFNMKIKFLFLVLSVVILTSCKGIPGADARKYPANPEERVKRNLAEGKGFTLNKTLGNVVTKGGSFDFASSNELWRASLDIIDFMPLTSVNYSGGIIITDWYSENNSNESIKISIRFLTNELRADALDIKVFNRTCTKSLLNCKIIETEGVLASELKREILKKAALYQKQDKEKKN